MLGRLMPREGKFFELFNAHAERIVEGSRELAAMIGTFTELDAHARRIDAAERAADKITHETMTLLHKTFITPFDRDQIHQLINTMDDILDLHQDVAESVALCEKAGIDAARIPDCLAGGYADSNLMKAYWPRMVQRDFAPRGYVRQLLKDLEMVAKWGGELDATTPMLTQALGLYRELAALGHAELDSSAIRKLYD